MSFAALPAELQLRIITECVEARQTSSSFFVPRRNDLRVQQATTLALVSRSFHAMVASILFRSLRVVRPSALLDLQAIFRRRPQLCHLIFKLHIGPDSELPDKGWPFEDGSERLDERDNRIKTSLGQSEEEQRPRWCKPGAEFSFGYQARHCQVVRVGDAIWAALADLDAEAWRRGYSMSGQRIGVREWAARLCLVQAALDLYIIEMRRIEDASGYDVGSWRDANLGFGTHWITTTCQESECGHYPHLKVVPASPRPAPSGDIAKSGQELFTITEAQLWKHILRRRGPTDHFDHLIRFTSSTPRSLEMTHGRNEWRRVRLDLGGPLPLRFTNAEWHYKLGTQSNESSQPYYDGADDGEGDSFPGWIDERSDDEDSTSTEAEPRACSPMDGHRVEDLVEAAGSLLTVSPNISSLSLTGYFHKALPSLAAPEALRSLVIGPRARYWNDALPTLDPLRFDGLVRLRVVGKMTRSDIDKIVQGLPKVRDIEWEVPDKAVNTQNFYGNVVNLQGYSPASPPPRRALPPLKRPRESPEDKGGSSDSEEEMLNFSTLAKYPPSPPLPAPPIRRIVILLHPEVAAKVFELPACNTQARRDAWENGSKLPRTKHLIHIKASEAVRSRSVATLSGGLVTDWDALHGKSLEWWVEG